MRQELRFIRDRVTALLDSLDVSVNVAPKAEAQVDTGAYGSRVEIFLFRC